MILKELRIILPMNPEEYKRGRFYSLCSKRSTKEDARFSVVRTQSFNPEKLFVQKGAANIPEGQYVEKKRLIPEPMMTLINKMFPGVTDQVREEVWSAFPFSRAVYTYGDSAAAAFTLTVESVYVADDIARQDNIFDLTPEELRERDLEVHDLTEKEGAPGKDLMTIYKLIKSESNKSGPFTKVESFFINTEEKVVTKFHQEVCNARAKWKDISLENQVKEVKESGDLLEEVKKSLLADLSVQSVSC